MGGAGTGYPTDLLDRRGPGPITEIQRACVDEATLACVKDVSRALMGGEPADPLAAAVHAAVVAQIDGMDAAERFLGARSMEPERLHRFLAFIALVIGEGERAEHHLALGWPGPVDDHLGDADRATIIANLARLDMAAERSQRAIMRRLIRAFRVEGQNDRMSIPEAQRVQMMEVFALSGKERGYIRIVGMLDGAGAWTDGGHKRRARLTNWVATRDLTKTPQEIEDSHAKIASAFDRDAVRSGIISRLITEGQGDKAARLVPLIEGPLVGALSRLTLAEAGMTGLDRAARLALVDGIDLEVPPLARRGDFAVRVHLARAALGAEGAEADTEAALAAFLEGDGVAGFADLALRLARAGRAGEALRVALYAPNARIAVFNAVSGMVEAAP